MHGKMRTADFGESRPEARYLFADWRQKQNCNQKRKSDENDLPQKHLLSGGGQQLRRRVPLNPINRFI